MEWQTDGHVTHLLEDGAKDGGVGACCRRLQRRLGLFCAASCLDSNPTTLEPTFARCGGPTLSRHEESGEAVPEVALIAPGCNVGTPGLGQVSATRGRAGVLRLRVG